MRRPAAWLAALFVLTAGAGARAESALRLPLPDRFGEIDAGTFDAAGQRVGEAQIRLARLGDAQVELAARSGIEGSARSEVSARMQLVDGGRALRLLSQRSESFDTSGASLGVLSIDHERREARCGAPPGSGDEDAVVKLAERDRVVNVPLNLLFQRLVTGEVPELDFEVLLCRFGARVIEAHARIATPATAQGGLVEVRYELDLGLLSAVAAPFLPTLSFWFDRESPGAWVAHRMPLFSKGPTVLVVRSDVSPERVLPHVGAGGL